MAAEDIVELRRGFRRATDKEVVTLLALRAVEQSTAEQLTVVSLEDGMRAGFDFLLHVPVPGETNVETPADPVLEALRSEARIRVNSAYYRSLNG